MPYAQSGGAGNIQSSQIVDDTIVDADINSAAAISMSKIALTSKAGTSAGPSGSGTQQITHGLGRTPKIIRVYSVGNFNTGESGMSKGIYNASGNNCIYILGSAGGAKTATADNANSLALSNSSAVLATGVIQNVGATTFDIVWTAAGDISAQTVFMWEAE